MRRVKIILLGVVFLSALAIASCGSKKVKEKDCSQKAEKKECCEKKDSTSCEKKCGGMNADSTKKPE